MVKVIIERTREDGTTYEAKYEIEPGQANTVLEILDLIYRKYEPSLSYRYSCRIGVCGTCSVITNGKPGLSCLRNAEPDEDGCLHIKAMPRGRTLIDLVKE